MSDMGQYGCHMCHQESEETVLAMLKQMQGLLFRTCITQALPGRKQHCHINVSDGHDTPCIPFITLVLGIFHLSVVVIPHIVMGHGSLETGVWLKLQGPEETRKYRRMFAREEPKLGWNCSLVMTIKLQLLASVVRLYFLLKQLRQTKSSNSLLPSEGLLSASICRGS